MFFLQIILFLLQNIPHDLISPSRNNFSSSFLCSKFLIKAEFYEVSAHWSLFGPVLFTSTVEVEINLHVKETFERTQQKFSYRNSWLDLENIVRGK